MSLDTFTAACLLQKTSDNSQWLGFIDVVSGVATLQPVTIPMPVSLTPTYSFVRTLPNDPAIIYIVGIPLSTGNCDIYRYDGHTSTFSLLLSVSGADNFSCPVELVFDNLHAEHVYAVVGTWNTRAQNFHQVLATDSVAGLYDSTAGSAFTYLCASAFYPYNGANINHPNTAIAAAYRVSSPDDLIATLHAQTISGGPGQSVISMTGVTGLSPNEISNSYITGFMYVTLGVIQWHPEWSVQGWWMIYNQSGVGAYALPNQTVMRNFSADWLTEAVQPEGPAVLSGAVGGLFYDGSGDGFIFDTNGFLHIYQLTVYGSVATEIIPETTGLGAGWRSFAIHPSEPTGLIGYQGLTGTDGRLYFTTDGGGSWTAYDPTGYSVLGLDFGVGSSPPPGANIWPTSITSRDARGDIAVTQFYTQAGSAALALTQARQITDSLASLSNCYVENVMGAWTIHPVLHVYGVDSLYSSVEIKLILAFLDTNGGIIQVEVPSPKAEVFLSDGEDLDYSNVDLDNCIAQLLANNLCGRGGFVASFLIGGRRAQSRRRRRQSIFSLNPSETGPGE